MQTDSEQIKEYKKSFLASWVPYFKKRYVFFLLATVVSIVLPFITIGGHHLFLLSFDHMRLELLGVVFDMQELYLIPFLLIILFMFIFFLTTLGGRVWCGWACPQTIFRVIYRDVIEGWMLGMHGRRNKQKSSSNGAKKAVAVLIWSLLSLLAAANLLWYFVPPEDFFSYILNPSEHITLYIFWIVTAAFLVYDVVWLAEDFCVYVCPYARIQSAMYDDDTIMEIYDEKRGGVIYDESKNKIADKPSQGDCVGCMACVNVCPTHIDIRKGLQLECINCLECADACAPVMASLGKQNLIHWTSYEAMKNGKTRIVRFRILAYIVAMILAMIGLFALGSKKEHMLLNINRSSELYAVKEGSRVDNIYTFLFQNTDSKAHTYYFEVIGSNDIRIIRPSEPFKLGAQQKANKVVILTTDKALVRNDRKDTPIPIQIRAFAVDDKEHVSVVRDTVFFYPSLEVIEEARRKAQEAGR